MTGRKDIERGTIRSIRSSTISSDRRCQWFDFVGLPAGYPTVPTKQETNIILHRSSSSDYNFRRITLRSSYISCVLRSRENDQNLSRQSDESKRASCQLFEYRPPKANENQNLTIEIMISAFNTFQVSAPLLTVTDLQFGEFIQHFGERLWENVSPYCIVTFWTIIVSRTANSFYWSLLLYNWCVHITSNQIISHHIKFASIIKSYFTWTAYGARSNSRRNLNLYNFIKITVLHGRHLQKYGHIRL